MPLGQRLTIRSQLYALALCSLCSRQRQAVQKNRFPVLIWALFFLTAELLSLRIMRPSANSTPLPTQLLPVPSPVAASSRVLLPPLWLSPLHSLPYHGASKCCPKCWVSAVCLTKKTRPFKNTFCACVAGVSGIMARLVCLLKLCGTTLPGTFIFSLPPSQSTPW